MVAPLEDFNSCPQPFQWVRTEIQFKPYSVLTQPREKSGCLKWAQWIFLNTAARINLASKDGRQLMKASHTTWITIRKRGKQIHLLDLNPTLRNFPKGINRENFICVILFACCKTPTPNAPRSCVCSARRVRVPGLHPLFWRATCLAYRARRVGHNQLCASHLRRASSMPVHRCGSLQDSISSSRLGAATRCGRREEAWSRRAHFTAK